MDARQAEFLRKRIADAARTEPRWLALRERLLSIGGKEIVVGFAEYFSDGISPSALTKRARLFDARGVLKVTGAGGECHHNTAALCSGEQLWRFLRRRDLPKVKIATGWALYEDGLWRNHSWGVTTDGTVVETTVPFAAYFGVVLSPAEQERFVKKVLKT